MKCLSFFLLPSFFLLVVNVYSQDQPAQVKKSDEPYKAQAQNVSIGNPAYSQIALQFWKDYDVNNLENSLANFSDNCTVYLADGVVIKGKENFFKALHEYRNSYSNVSSNAIACTTLKSPDNPNYEVAVIWGTSTETKKEGSIRKIYMHEMFVINQEGKIQEFRHLFSVLPQGN